MLTIPIPQKKWFITIVNHENTKWVLQKIPNECLWRERWPVWGYVGINLGHNFVKLQNHLEFWVWCLVSVQAGELCPSSIIETMLSKQVKTQKSNIKSCHFVENMLKI